LSEQYVGIAIGAGLTALGVFLNALVSAIRTRRREDVTRTNMQQELTEEAQLNIAVLDQLSIDLPLMEAKGMVAVRIPHRMSLAALHPAISTGGLRLFSDYSIQRRWRLIAAACESFNGFVTNTEQIAIQLLLQPPNAGLTIRYRLGQLNAQAKDTRQRIEELLNATKPGPGDKRWWRLWQKIGILH